MPDLDDDVLLAGHPQHLGSSEFAMYKPRRLVLVEHAVSGLYERGGAEMRNIGVHLERTDDIVGALSP